MAPAAEAAPIRMQPELLHYFLAEPLIVLKDPVPAVAAKAPIATTVKPPVEPVLTPQPLPREEQKAVEAAPAPAKAKPLAPAPLPDHADGAVVLVHARQGGVSLSPAAAEMIAKLAKAMKFTEEQLHVEVADYSEADLPGHLKGMKARQLICMGWPDQSRRGAKGPLPLYTPLKHKHWSLIATDEANKVSDDSSLKRVLWEALKG